MKLKKVINAMLGVAVSHALKDVIDSARSGFDTVVICPDENVRTVALRLLRAKLDSSEFIVEDSIEKCGESALENDCDDLVSLAVVVGIVAKGSGFIQHVMPPLGSMLPSVNRRIEFILDAMGLSVFIESFCAKKLAILREIDAVYGLSTFVDCVVQVAYFSGQCADEERAMRYLEKQRKEPVDRVDETGAEAFFRQIISQQERPHHFVKVALSYYAVNHLGMGLREAGEKLSVSRTTLWEHLRIAEQEGYAEFFSGMKKDPKYPRKQKEKMIEIMTDSCVEGIPEGDSEDEVD